MLAALLEQDHHQQAGWGRSSRGPFQTWNGAGAWPMLSQAWQVNFSRTVWITFCGVHFGHERILGRRGFGVPRNCNSIWPSRRSPRSERCSYNARLTFWMASL